MKENPAKLLAIGKIPAGYAAALAAFRTAGFEIEETETIDAALARLSGANFNFVFLSCPALDSEAMNKCLRLKIADPALPILMMIAQPSASVNYDDFGNLADCILVEPAAPLTLISIANTLLRLRSLSKASGSLTSGKSPMPTDHLHARLESLHISSIDALASIDADDLITSWNAVAERLSGYPAAEVLGKRLSDVNGTADTLGDRPQYLRHLHDGEPIEYQTVLHRKTGETVEIWVRGAPIKLDDGQIIGASFTARDVTALKQREQHVHFLMRELTHRSKNLLAVIQAMARQSLSHLSSPEEFVTRFSERLSGLAGSHDLLSNVDWEGAPIIDLIRSQLRHYEDRFDDRFSLEGPNLFLKPEAAQNIGIALHELSTNAAKYGALSVPGGHVSISWALKTEKDAQRLQMIWQEKGGPAVVAPTRKGFGHVVMDRITGQALGGTSQAEFNPDGVIWKLDVPAASIVAEREKPN